MAPKFDVEELVKRKKELEACLIKCIEKDVRKFTDDTGFTIRNVVASVNKDTAEVEYLNCDVFFE